ncbi:endocuticle structural glycoprotein SgAbd-8-like [Cherax quadricarinatus]|uniref:endocuticle structural glycoprotein SgAbd-8-like n=1 Tax=Cherax quadricarinatus TaxID=27406 RepID=UPI00387EA755
MARVFFCVMLLVLAVVVAGTGITPSYGPKPVIPILKDDRKQNAYGEYAFQYETGDGITRKESGSQKDGQVSQGGWRYTSPYGDPVEITFVADHGGFQPYGDALPVAPALPYSRTGQ